MSGISYVSFWSILSNFAVIYEVRFEDEMIDIRGVKKIVDVEKRGINGRCLLVFLVID